MRGQPICTGNVQNGFNHTVKEICGHNSSHGNISTEIFSARLTGTLVVPNAASMWFNFSAVVGTKSWLRLWVDDHRIVDSWPPTALSSADRAGGKFAPVTPSLLPNCTLEHKRPVSIRVDMRPNDTYILFLLQWTSNPGHPYVAVPSSQALSMLIL